jgi:enamine deaminase RidA (YjgF/YER057c/UK114 family)
VNETNGGARIVNPEELGAPRGFSHGVLSEPGARVLHVGGQIGVDEGTAPHEAPALLAQFDRALANVAAVVREAGGTPEHVARMTVYVTDMDQYRASRSLLGDVWRRSMGRHYPAMSLVEVKSLFEPAALVEIEATAMIP